MKPATPLPRQPFVGLALAIATGILLADLRPNQSPLTLVALAILAAAAWFTKRSILVYGFVVAALFLLHSFRVGDSPTARLADELGEEPRPVTVRGWVVTEPKVGPSGTASFVLHAESIEIDGAMRICHMKFLARWRGPVALGDEVNLFGTAEPVERPRNPGEFNMRAYLARQDVRRLLIVRYPENGVILKRKGSNPLPRAARKARDWMQRVLSRDLENSPDVTGIIQGMILGLRHQTSEDIEEPFQQTGTLHLFAVAGLHVGIIGRLLWTVATVFRLSRTWATGLIIPALFFYSALTGLHISSVRAAVMSAAFLAGFFAERRVLPLNNLAAAATLILCWDTNELFSVGFQLSFLVVTAILLLADPVFRFSRHLFEPDPFLPRSLFGLRLKIFERTTKWLARAGSVSFAASVGSFPLMITYFSIVTPISLLANLVVVPLAFFVLAGGLLSAMTAPISTTLSVVFNNANWLLTKMILGSVLLFGRIPGGHFYVDHSPGPRNLVEINALDLKSGAAIHLRTAAGDWLIDAGGSRDYERTVRQYLRFRGIDCLNGLVLTHGDAAHIGGASAVLRDFLPRQLIDTATPDRSFIHRKLVADLDRNNYPRRCCVAGDHLDLSSAVKARVLFPPARFKGGRADDQALVMQLEILGQPRVLLMSDSGLATEKFLLEHYPDLQADILLKGQHYSGISGSAAFLDAVRPQVIVATSRDFPRTECLNEEWVATLRPRNIRLLRQDETGAVRIYIFKNHWEAKAYVSGEIFRSAR